MKESEVAQARPGPGRPRKWASDAERVKAYRQRKAEEHASADELRVERLVLRRQLADARRRLQRAESAAALATTKVAKLSEELEHARAALAQDRAEIARLREHLKRVRAVQLDRQPREAQPTKTMSRAQRRAAQRGGRKPRA